jgi:uncharacterized protein YneF (UPF0154 family)
MIDAESVLIPLGVFAAFVAIVALFTGLAGLWVVNRTMREALKTNPDSLPLLTGQMQQRRPWNLEIWGLVGMATGAALAVAAAIGAPEARTLLLQTSLLPGFIGAALFGQRWLPRRPDAPALGHLPAE